MASQLTHERRPGAANVPDVEVEAQPSALRQVSEAPKQFISFQEAERLTGVGRERLRTWHRRHGLEVAAPDETGRWRVRAALVPEILAVRQLVAGGMAVSEAVAQVKRSGVPAPDLSSAERLFGQLAAPVLIFSGPHPLKVVWANAAAVAQRPDAVGWVPGRHEVSQIALQRLLADPEGCSALITHEGAGGTPAASAVAWSIGHAAGGAALAVVLDLPHVQHGEARQCPACNPAPADDRQWTAALRQARAALQRGAGLAAVDGALAAFADGIGATDAALAIRQDQELRIRRTVRGNLYRPVVACADVAWEPILASQGPTWLPSQTSEQLSAGTESPMLGLPLIAGGELVGLAILAFGERPAINEQARDFLDAFAATTAGALRRDQAVAVRRRLAAELASSDRPTTDI